MLTVPTGCCQGAPALTVNQLLQSLDAALEEFFNEMPVLYQQLSSTFVADLSKVGIHHTVTSDDDMIGTVAVVGGATAGAMLAGGGGTALLVGAVLTPFAAGVVGAIAAGAAIGAVIHLLGGG